MDIVVKSFLLAFSSTVTQLALGLMGIVGFYLVGMLRRVGQRRKKLEAFCDALPPEGTAVMKITLEELASKLPDKSLRDAWKEFVEHLIERDGEISNVHQVEEFLSDERATHGISFFPVSYRFVSITPGLFTSIGLLGTFTGVALGLAELDPKHILESVTGVIAGLSTAFWTSIVGVVLSSIASILVGHWDQKLHERLTLLHDAVNRLVPRTTVEALVVAEQKNEARDRGQMLELLRRQVAASRATQEAMKVGVDLRADFTKLVELTVEGNTQLKFIADDLADKVSSGIVKELRPLMEGVSRGLDSHMSSSSQESVQQVREFAGQMVEQLNASLNSSFDEMGEKFGEVSGTMSRLTESLQDVVANAESAVNRQQQATQTTSEAVEVAIARATQSDEQLTRVMAALESIAAQTEAMQEQQRSAQALQGQQAGQYGRIEQGLGGLNESFEQGQNAYVASAAALNETAGSLRSMIGVPPAQTPYFRG